MTFKPMPVLTGLSLVCLVILVLLGNWQYARYTEKMALPSLEEQVDQSTQIQVAIDRSRSGNVQQVYGAADSEPIWRRYAVGTRIGIDETVLVLVDATGGPEQRPLTFADAPELISFDGTVLAKEASRSAFSSEDDPEQDTWFVLDPEGIANHLGLSQTPRVAEPLVMTVRNSADMTQSRRTANPYAQAKAIDPLPPERHFGYAITWWGMALGLIGVYLALHRSRGRLTF